RFQEVLELEKGSQTRVQSLAQIKEEQPHLAQQIDDVLAKYATYREGKRFLDGPGDLKRLVRGAGKLEFRILEPPSPDNPQKHQRYRRQLQEERREIVPGDPVGWFKIDEPMQFFNFESPAELAQFNPENDPTHVVEKVGDDYYVLAKLGPRDGLLQGDKTQRPWKLRGARVDRDDNGRPSVSFALDVVGGGMFETLTRANIGQQLCILVDDVAYSSAVIQSAIRTNGQITGEFSPDKVRYLVQTMEGGMLPGRLKDTPLSEITVGSSLGEVNRDSAVRAGLYGAIAVVIVMILYYWYCGAIAVVALSMNVLLVLAALAMLNARITLDGIAGIILAVGMAVDANVLIYERMREEKDRGASLRMIVKNGYDKALSTIFDSNITTLLTCVIIFYVGSEEVKGFGLTLGWGIVLNLFTSVFVTRTLFTLLLKLNLIKNIGMMRLIGVPKIDWYAKRKFFLPLSFVVLVIGLFLLWERGRDNVLDVEFLGGVTAEVEMKPPLEGEQDLNDREIRDALANVADGIRDDAELLSSATVTAASDIGAYHVRVEGIDGPRLAAMITEPLDAKNLLERNVGDGGVVATPGQQEVTVYLQADKTQEALTAAIQGLKLQDDAGNLRKATVNAVLSVGDVEQAGRIWNVTTTVTNMRLVEYALTEALGEHMKIQPSVQYAFRGAGDRPYPITARNLADVVPGLPLGVNASVTDYLGGAAIYLDQLDPPQSLDALRTRIGNMYFKPDYADQPRRDFDVLGIERAGEEVDDEGRPLYRGVVVVSVDPDVLYSVDPEAWWTDFAKGQLSLVQTALSTEQTLRRVMQFKPQIAAQSTRQASVALLLAWAMIIGYVWIRFGRPIYGVAAVSALIHDALIALAFVGFSGWLGGVDHPIGNALLISDFKINMTIVA
ncbi:MAG: protein translocase subunit SecD, partial [Phycisphaerae bacterium]|nr:protein translocase subunit SecD [Phycisphaerae bacterium]